jgi:hypothetical protein
VVAGSLGAFGWAGVRYRRRERAAYEEGAIGAVCRKIADLVPGQRQLQAFLVANGLWELALSALKTFVVLYVTKTMGCRSPSRRWSSGRRRSSSWRAPSSAGPSAIASGACA